VAAQRRHRPADRIDTVMNSMQAPIRRPARDAMRVDTSLEKLGAGDLSLLACRDAGGDVEK
jgi:hypothetical protein